MISTATRTTATVSPLSPLTNGNAVAQSANSGFAAALRKLAKQAEDPRGQMHPVVPSGAVPEEYLRGLRPFPTPEDLRLSSLPLGLDPTTAAHAAAAYYHPAYLHHPLALHRMEESMCLSALRSQFYSQMARAVESHYLAELQARRPPPEGRVTPGERLTPSRPDKMKEQDHSSLPTQKPLSHQHGLQSSLGSIPYPVPSLVPSHMGKHQAATAAGLHGQLAAAMMSHRAGEEGWLSRQRRQERHEREGPPELCLRLPGKGAEPRRDTHRVNSLQQHSNNRETNPRLGGPPPLISPKTSSAHPSHPPRPPHPPATLWNPASLVNTPMDSHHKAPAPGPPSRPPPGLTRADRAPTWTERLEDGERSRAEALESSGELKGPSSGVRERQGAPVAPRSTLVYDEALQQHRLLLSKLDLMEKRRREAREGGYYYELEESYDESDEEEKVEFLGLLGLTTQRHRHQAKKKSCPSPLTTPYTAQQMDSSPKLEEKKGFLQMFSLEHVTVQQRKDKEHTEGLLRAIQKKTLTLDTLRYNSIPPSSSPPPPPIGDSSEVRLQGQSNGQSFPGSPGSSPPHSHPINNHRGDPFKPHPDTQIPRHPLPALLHAGEKTAFKTPLQSTKKPPQPQAPAHHQHSHLPPAPRKEPGPGLHNGSSRPWEKFTPEAFAQQFHHAVLQSTHHTLQSNGVPEVNMKATPSLPLNMSSSMKRPRGPSSPPPRPAYHNNGHRSQYPGARPPPGSQEHLRWSGIEAIFEAYQEYTEEWSVERQVLHSQCKRLEAQNHTLTRAAEQMSLTMGELVGQRQKVREERERLQAQLEHFRRCLTLPSIHWGRGQVNSHGGPR
ncbi:hypothetical protein NHX12_002633 [Muraenolepis orangiensis]|uniref:Genetic suppressor element-like domain-containing protein n=1 Tax=Muraenolepis orangiensis TaxID=630683 RepID=A0A9Q0DUV3_9TELE|nr:hypothetical protein NHX12_002633 [Muraenolepis orangiensis]